MLDGGLWWQPYVCVGLPSDQQLQLLHSTCSADPLVLLVDGSFFLNVCSESTYIHTDLSSAAVNTSIITSPCHSIRSRNRFSCVAVWAYEVHTTLLFVQMS